MFSVLSDPAIYEFENEPPISVEWLSRRYQDLEQRRSADDTEMWLNWAVRLPDGRLAGYVEAAVLPSAAACVAYELSSRYWRQGIGSSAVAAMLEELQSEYRVDTFVAALKSANVRSLGLLRSLGFSVAKEQRVEELRGEPDEVVMIKSTTPSAPGS
jgi:RimJ/RimL family protein N-acetyltransferase